MKKYLLLCLLIPSISFADKALDDPCPGIGNNYCTYTIENTCVLITHVYSGYSATKLHDGKCND